MLVITYTESLCTEAVSDYYYLYINFRIVNQMYLLSISKIKGEAVFNNGKKLINVCEK